MRPTAPITIREFFVLGIIDLLHTRSRLRQHEVGLHAQAPAVRAGGGNVEYVEHLADVPSHLAPSLRPGDTLVLMGAGDVATIWTDIVDQIGDDR